MVILGMTRTKCLLFHNFHAIIKVEDIGKGGKKQ